jgi:hypothetical protein
MRTEPVNIAGLAGPVVVTVNAVTGKHSVTVGGRPATGGTRRGDYGLPTTDGRTVAAKVRSSLLDPYPTIEIAGVKYRTGPSVPVALRVLALLPLVLVLGGLIGGVIGALGIATNLGIARWSQSNAVKAVLMIVVLVIAVVLFAVVAAALQ